MWPFTGKKKKRSPLSDEKAERLIEEGKRRTGLSEAQLERLFLEDLIQQGINPFEDAPEHVRLSLERKHPDLAAQVNHNFSRHPVSPVGSAKVPRNWNDLPSMVLTPVPHQFSYAHLARVIAAQAADKQFVHIATIGWTQDQVQAFKLRDWLFAFNDDPKLVLLRFPVTAGVEDNMVVRATFMRDTAGEIDQTTLPALAEQLAKMARERGLHVDTVRS